MQKNVLNYRIIIEPETYPDGSTVYVAYCPTLGISDYGDTVEAVIQSIRSGISLAIESLAKKWTQVAVHPKPVPQGTLRVILKQAQISGETLLEKL